MPEDFTDCSQGSLRKPCFATIFSAQTRKTLGASARRNREGAIAKAQSRLEKNAQPAIAFPGAICYNGFKQAQKGCLYGQAKGGFHRPRGD
jgi:hypothetical protein